MATRRPLIQIAGELRELPAGDALAEISATLDTLPKNAGSVQSIAVKVGGVWVQIPWADFLALIGDVTPPPPAGSNVTIDGVQVTINGEDVVINGGATAAVKVTVNGEQMTINGTDIEVTT